MSDVGKETGAPTPGLDETQIPEEQRAHDGPPAADRSRGRRFLRELAGGSAAVSILSIVVGLLVGAVNSSAELTRRSRTSSASPTASYSW